MFLVVGIKIETPVGSFMLKIETPVGSFMLCAHCTLHSKWPKATVDTAQTPLSPFITFFSYLYHNIYYCKWAFFPYIIMILFSRIYSSKKEKGKTGTQ